MFLKKKKKTQQQQQQQQKTMFLESIFSFFNSFPLAISLVIPKSFLMFNPSGFFFSFLMVTKGEKAGGIN